MPVRCIVRDAGSARYLTEREIARAYFTDQGNSGLEQRLAKIFVMVGLGARHVFFLSDYVDSGNISGLSLCCQCQHMQDRTPSDAGRENVDGRSGQELFIQ